jgi:hypothetical protein
LLFGLNNGSVNIPHVAYFFLLVNNANLYVRYQQVLADPKASKKSLRRLAARPGKGTKSDRAAIHSGSSSFRPSPRSTPPNDRFQAVLQMVLQPLLLSPPPSPEDNNPPGGC